jgi:hypothetical protein
MPIITVILVLALVGLMMWAINTYLPMQPTIKNILNIVVVIVVVLWLLNVFGVLGALGGAGNVPRLNQGATTPRAGHLNVN